MQESKTRKFLIATHGTFAKGIQSSLDLIIGATDNMFIIQAYITENKSIEDDLNAVLKNVGENDELIIFTDLLGGSVTNQILRITSGMDVHIISGFNLPLLIDVLLADAETPVNEVIEDALKNAKDQMVYVNKLMNQNKEDSLDD